MPLCAHGSADVRAKAEWDALLVVLRPRPMNKLANAAPGTVVAVLGLTLFVEGTGPLSVAGMAVPIGILARLARLSNGRRDASRLRHCLGNGADPNHPSRSHQRGDQLPRHRLERYGRPSSLGPVLAFQTPSRTLPGVAEHHAECLRRLRKWVRKH